VSMPPRPPTNRTGDAPIGPQPDAAGDDPVPVSSPRPPSDDPVSRKDTGHDENIIAFTDPHKASQTKDTANNAHANSSESSEQVPTTATNRYNRDGNKRPKWVYRGQVEYVAGIEGEQLRGDLSAAVAELLRWSNTQARTGNADEESEAA